jgi:hypothetical protein
MSVSLPSSLGAIATGAFAASGLTQITLPDSVTTLVTYNYSGSTIHTRDLGVFTGCVSLTRATLGSGISALPNNTFKDCAALSTVTLPDTCASIGKAAFYNCAILNRFILPRQLAIIGSQAFYGVGPAISAYAGSSAIAAAEAAGLSITIIPDPYAGKVADVTASPAPGAVTVGTAVTLSTATAGAEIRYTTDGGEPTVSGALYTGPIAITANTTIKAKAFKSGLTDSDALTAVYTVSAAPIPVTGVSLDRSTASLAVNAVLTLAATVTPAGATNQSVSWTSGSPSVATVNNNGLVTGIAAGTAVITVTTADGGYTANCTVTVTAASVPPGAPVVTVGTVTGSPGDVVAVPVTLANNPGIAGFSFTLSFDRTRLEPVEIFQSPALTGGVFASNLQAGGDLSALEFVTATWSRAANFTADGVIYSVKFKIKADAPEVTTPLTLTGSATNQNFANVDFTAQPGGIRILRFIYGNIFSDGGDTSIDIKDAVKLAQYLAGWSTVTLSVSELQAADVYADGEINVKDAVKLAQYLAGWPNIVLGPDEN